MSRIRQLAMAWQAQATDDARDIGRVPPEIRGERADHAATRRNCAWELLRVLNEMEKENPLEGGSLRSSQPDGTSG